MAKSIGRTVDMAARLGTTGAELAETAVKAGEMAVAAGTVIGHRVALGARGDISEVTRMSTEKIAAFTAAGSAILGEWHDIQREFARLALAQAQASAGAAFSLGLGLTPFGLISLHQRYIADTMSRTTDHSVRIAALAAGVGGVALDPVHRTAIDNARRLTRAAVRKRPRS
jgi:hypothetical protein